MKRRLGAVLSTHYLRSSKGRLTLFSTLNCRCFRTVASAALAETDSVTAVNDSSAISVSDSEMSLLSEIQEMATTQAQKAECTSLATSTLGTEDADAVLKTLTDSGIIHLQPSDFFYARILPVRTVQFLMDWSSDHIPFWVFVLAVPWLTKMLMIWPVIIRSQLKHQRRMHLIPKAMREFYEVQVKYRNDDKNKWNVENSKLLTKYGFNPYTVNFGQMTPALLQMPVHLTLFVAIRTMYPRYEAWTNGGTLWFQNLAVADDTYLLPAFCGLSMFASAYVFLLKSQRGNSLLGENRVAAGNTLMSPELILTTGGLFAAAMVPLTHYFSAGFNLYLASNLLSFVIQSHATTDDRIRAVFGLKPISYGNHFNSVIAETTREIKKQAKGNKEAMLTEFQGRRKGRDGVRKSF